MATYKLSLSDFQGEVEMYERYKESIDRAREMDRWSAYMRSIESRQLADKNKLKNFDTNMAESRSTKK